LAREIGKDAATSLLVVDRPGVQPNSPEMRTHRLVERILERQRGTVGLTIRIAIRPIGSVAHWTRLNVRTRPAPESRVQRFRKANERTRTVRRILWKELVLLTAGTQRKSARAHQQ